MAQGAYPDLDLWHVGGLQTGETNPVTIDLDNMQIAQQTLVEKITEQVGRAWEVKFEQLRAELAAAASANSGTELRTRRPSIDTNGAREIASLAERAAAASACDTNAGQASVDIFPEICATKPSCTLFKFCVMDSAMVVSVAAS